MTNLSIFNKQIRTFNNLYSLNDLHKASGGSKTHQPTNFIRQSITQDLINEIVSSSDLRSTINIQKSKGTWVCKELVYAYAMWISPKFHLQVIRAFDSLHNQPALTPIDKLDFIRQRWLVVVEKGEVTQKVALDHDDVVINRNNLAEAIADHDLFPVTELINAQRIFNERIEVFVKWKAGQ